ncbi:glycoside hydrolase family 6 protein [Streptomyces sodiiphilus]|uniref:Glucanase n=1 Tax=Streptomyces sodiiphilus TaxID=226217 RepID=A0ABN2NRV1_9ACTN
MYGSVLPPGARPGRGPRAAAAAVLAGALVLVLGCSSPGDGAASAGAEPSGPGEPESAESGEFWVDPDSPAAQQVERWKREGRSEEAEVLSRIAEQPLAHWPTGEDDPGPEVKLIAEAARAEGRTAVLVAYNVPHRDCGQYSQGGAPDVAAYQEWIGSFADNLEDADAIVVLEPDAVPHLADGCTDAMYHEERYQVLSEAVDRLKAQPNTRVYIDAGNPSWIPDPGALAEPLWRSGIAHADGFALNVSNFQTLQDSARYGRELSGLLDGAHFVIDTSRNGNGPLDEPGDEAWCNPPGRGLGVPPTTDTGDELIDAYLWIKRPGESDGECRGGPAPGQWWPEYALELARRASH